MTRLFLVMTMIVTLCASSGCHPIVLCNGTGQSLVFELNGSIAYEIDPCGCELKLVPGGGDFDLKIYNIGGTLVADSSTFEAQTYSWNVYNGFDFSKVAFVVGPQPDMSEKSLVVLCNQSSDDVLVVPSGVNTITNAWQVRASETDDFVTIATGQKSFRVYDPADTENSLAFCSIDVSDGDQVIWDGTNLICKEAVVLELVNTSVDVVDIVWLEGKGNLIRTVLGSDESRSLGVPIGEVATFEAELNGTVVDSCTLSDPMAGHQIVWDGTELTGCDPPDPPDPTQMATIDLHNIGTSAGPVIFVEAGKDPLTEGVRVIKFVPNSLDFPTGAPVSIQVWSGEGVTLHGECTINDPTDGDSATWDGVNVTCEDL